MHARNPWLLSTLIRQDNHIRYMPMKMPCRRGKILSLKQCFCTWGQVRIHLVGFFPFPPFSLPRSYECNHVHVFYSTIWPNFFFLFLVNQPIAFYEKKKKTMHNFSWLITESLFKVLSQHFALLFVNSMTHAPNYSPWNPKSQICNSGNCRVSSVLTVCYRHEGIIVCKKSSI